MVGTSASSIQNTIFDDLPDDVLRIHFLPFLSPEHEENVNTFLNLRLASKRVNRILNDEPALWGLTCTKEELAGKNSTPFKEWLPIKLRADLAKHRLDSPEAYQRSLERLALARQLLNETQYQALVALTQNQRPALLEKLKSFLMGERKEFIKGILAMIPLILGVVVCFWLTDPTPGAAFKIVGNEFDCRYETLYPENKAFCLASIQRKTLGAFIYSILFGTSVALTLRFFALALKARWDYLYLRVTPTRFLSSRWPRLLDKAWKIANLLSLIAGTILIEQLTQIRSMDVDLNHYATNSTDTPFNDHELEKDVNAHLKTEAYLGNIGSFCLAFSSIILLQWLCVSLKTSAQKFFRRSNNVTLFSSRDTQSYEDDLDSISVETPLVSSASPAYANV